MTIRYKGHYVGTIGETKFNKQELCRIRQTIGIIFPSDKGKQVYALNGIYQVETDSQRDRRFSCRKKECLTTNPN